MRIRVRIALPGEDERQHVTNTGVNSARFSTRTEKECGSPIFSSVPRRRLAFPEDAEMRR